MNDDRQRERLQEAMDELDRTMTRTLGHLRYYAEVLAGPGANFVAANLSVAASETKKARDSLREAQESAERLHVGLVEDEDD